MPRQLIFLLSIYIVLFCTAGCKGRWYVAPTESMESTIMLRERFYVTTTNKFERNDIVVFDYYGDNYSAPLDEPGKFEQHWEKRVYRLIAVSEDSLEIKNGDVFVNSKLAPMARTAKTDFEIRSLVPIPELNELGFENMHMEKIGDTINYWVTLSIQEKNKLEETNRSIIDIKKHLVPDLNDTLYAKATDNGNWGSDNYGPLRIPVPGETITVDETNFKFYRNIPDIKMGNNIIKEKLYFVMGDNRHQAQDSRFIGLISHSNMYGVVK